MSKNHLFFLNKSLSGKENGVTNIFDYIIKKQEPPSNLEIATVIRDLLLTL